MWEAATRAVKSRKIAQTQVVLPLHPNEEIALSLHSIQPLLDQHQLQWHDYGRIPDCQFTSFIHASKKTVPALEVIMEVRRAVRNCLFVHPPLLVNQSQNGKTVSRHLVSTTEPGKKETNTHCVVLQVLLQPVFLNLVHNKLDS